MKAQLREVDDHGHRYTGLVFWCPGCERIDEDGERHAGLHMLPVAGDANGRPSWEFDGNLDAPTLNPSILTKGSWAGVDTICHSYLRAGRFDFLADCTHQFAGQTVDLPELPDWASRDEDRPI